MPSLALQRRTERRFGAGAKVLKAVHPNEGIRAEYRRRLDALIEAMHSSVVYWLTAAYRANEPVIAQDAMPADVLQKVMKQLGEQWQSRFDDAAEKLAEYFAQDVSQRSDADLKRILRDAGFSVKFTLTAAQRDVLKATVHQNVQLIKSIPQKYLDDVQGMVMRSVQTGRDLGQLTKDLQEAFGVTRRRAAFIALDQNNKASSAMNHARQQELGITTAVWMHSHAGKTPRPSHVAMDGKNYDITKGMWDKDESAWVFPGQLPRCRCSSRPVLLGFQ